MPRRPLVAVLLIFLSAAVDAALSPNGPLASFRSASAPAVLPNLTLSFDAKPAYSEFYSIQPGFKCVNGAVDHSATTKPASAAFIRDDSPGNVRHGRYSARVVLSPGDHAPYTCKAEGVAAIKGLGEGEGSESWWGWSWKLPVGWRGTDSWGMLFEFTALAPSGPRTACSTSTPPRGTASGSASTPA